MASGSASLTIRVLVLEKRLDYRNGATRERWRGERFELNLGRAWPLVGLTLTPSGPFDSDFATRELFGRFGSDARRASELPSALAAETR
jgi:hypothetical protein